MLSCFSQKILPFMRYAWKYCRTGQTIVGNIIRRMCFDCCITKAIHKHTHTHTYTHNTHTHTTYTHTHHIHTHTYRTHTHTHTHTHTTHTHTYHTHTHTQHTPNQGKVRQFSWYNSSFSLQCYIFIIFYCIFNVFYYILYYLL
jgi:hypothetical protein